MGNGVPDWTAASEGRLSLNNGEHGFWRMFGLQTRESANGLKERSSKHFRLVGHMVSVTASLLIVAEGGHRQYVNDGCGCVP